MVLTAMQEPRKPRRFKNGAWHGGLAALPFDHAEHKKLLDSLFVCAQNVQAWAPDI